MRSDPTPARASNEARAEPVAPQPTIATRPAASFRWPSAPTPPNRICREYRSSNFSFSFAFSMPCLKEVTSLLLQNLYYSWDAQAARIQTALALRASSNVGNGPEDTIF